MSSFYIKTPLLFALLALFTFSAVAEDIDLINDNLKRVTWKIDAKPLTWGLTKQQEQNIHIDKVRGVGSGLSFLTKESDGSVLLLGICDRGPQIDGPKIKGLKADSKIFFEPNFTPKIALIRFFNGNFRVERLINISFNEKKLALGVPPIDTVSEGEYPLDSKLNLIGSNNLGIDPEGIAISNVKKNSSMLTANVWLVDEYYPSLLEVELTLNLIQSSGGVTQLCSNANCENPNDAAIIKSQIKPGFGIPLVLKNRFLNRGFEGVTITSQGKVLAIMQSILNLSPPDNPKRLPNFVRLVSYDPKVNESQSFAVKLPALCSSNPKECKFGDIVSYGENSLLALLNFADKGYLLYLDLTSASELRKNSEPFVGEAYSKLDSTIISKLPEEQWSISPLMKRTDSFFSGGHTDSSFRGIEPEVLMDLSKFGWLKEKSEGIATIPSNDRQLFPAKRVLYNKDILIINDDDFQLRGELKMDLKRSKLVVDKYVKASLGKNKVSVEPVDDTQKRTDILYLQKQIKR
jgi:Esterase-like activity of phytase